MQKKIIVVDGIHEFIAIDISAATIPLLIMCIEIAHKYGVLRDIYV